MNIVISVILALVLFVCLYFVYLTKVSVAPDTALVNGKLRPCPETPNCVSSETTGEKFIEPLTSSGPIDELWQAAQTAAVAHGGIVQLSQPTHFWVTYESKLFKFTDDLELRRDDAAGVVHIRSSSRSGKSDLGVNRKRVEAIRAAIK